MNEIKISDLKNSFARVVSPSLSPQGMGVILFPSLLSSLTVSFLLPHNFISFFAFHSFSFFLSFFNLGNLY